METYLGYRVIIERPSKVKIERSIKDRLFTLPWKPLEKYKYEYLDTLEDGEILVCLDNIVVNQRTYESLKRDYD